MKTPPTHCIPIVTVCFVLFENCAKRLFTKICFFFAFDQMYWQLVLVKCCNVSNYEEGHIYLMAKCPQKFNIWKKSISSQHFNKA